MDQKLINFLARHTHEKLTIGIERDITTYTTKFECYKCGEWIRYTNDEISEEDIVKLRKMINNNGFKGKIKIINHSLLSYCLHNNS